MRYAQIDSNSICFAESFLSGEVNEEDMILLADNEPSPLGKRYVNGIWEEVDKEEMPQLPLIVKSLCKAYQNWNYKI